MNTTNDKNTTTTATAKTICKFGLDVHAASITVARQVEGLNPQPPQKFKVKDFLKWVKGQVDKGAHGVLALPFHAHASWATRPSVGAHCMGRGRYGAN